MTENKVMVSRGGFLFCRWTVAVILWCAFFLRSRELVILSCAILALSALLKIRKAPLVWIYTMTLGKLFQSSLEELDESAMRFAHSFGTVLHLIAISLLYLPNPRAGWLLVLILCFGKTAGAMGFCTALKIYGCLKSGGCCRFTGK
ncbi:MAG: DUF4395 family protein [Candidatus Wallbacteria bacterium]|nr:DUF4395 family protein [Candidatus Wallbacteria bacterium]